MKVISEISWELGTLKCVKENKLKLMLTEREKNSSLLSQEG